MFRFVSTRDEYFERNYPECWFFVFFYSKDAKKSSTKLKSKIFRPFCCPMKIPCQSLLGYFFTTIVPIVLFTFCSDLLCCFSLILDAQNVLFSLYIICLIPSVLLFCGISFPLLVFFVLLFLKVLTFHILFVLELL